jgi:peptide/nickel transport system permease protein
MRVIRRLLRDPVSAIALIGVVLLVVIAIFVPVVVHGDPYDNDLSIAMAAPGPGHILGADDQGRDMLVRLLYGLRLTMVIGIAAVLIGGAIGTLVGLVAAFYRRLDTALMRSMDVLLSFPAIRAVIVALSIATIPLAARIARATAVVEMGRDYIEAGRAVGLTNARLILRHLLPNCFSALLVWATLRFGQVILLASALSFIGMGAQPPTAELGAMTAEGRTFLFFAPHIVLVPCAAIFVIVLVFNMLGDGLRDALDPRLNR